MPPNEEVLSNALADLQQVKVESFTATPTSIGPFGESELRWEVSGPPSVKLKLGGKDVARRGSQVVRPVETRVYRLEAVAVGGLRAELARRVVEVDLSACTAFPVPEAEVQAQLLQVINDLLAQDTRVKTRRTPHIAISPEGIELELRFEIEIPGRNPDFNVDALIGLGVDGERVVAHFREFKADLDFSFWEDVLNFTIGAFAGGPFLHLAIALAEDNAEAKARREILDGIQRAVDGFLTLVPSGWAPQRVLFEEQQVTVRICPRSNATHVASFHHPDFRFARRSG